jgi:hypothetical protein
MFFWQLRSFLKPHGVFVSYCWLMVTIGVGCSGCECEPATDMRTTRDKLGQLLVGLMLKVQTSFVSGCVSVTHGMRLSSRFVTV